MPNEIDCCNNRTLAMCHIHHVLNHHYYVLLCHFAIFQLYMNFLDVEYHQHLCLIQNLVLTCLKM